MDKKLRSKGPKDPALKALVGEETEASSEPPGEGSSDPRIWVNERGEVCYGTECFTVAVDEERNEVRVNIKQSGDCDLDPIVDALKNILGNGARTVYEVESELKKS